MTFDDLQAEATRQGYQLVPVPTVIDHDLRPGDRVIETIEPWVKNVAALSGAAEGLAKLGVTLDPVEAVVLAVASRADVLLRYANGRVAFRMAKGLRGEPTVVKVP